jgi:hypothetical protein
MAAQRSAIGPSRRFHNSAPGRCWPNPDMPNGTGRAEIDPFRNLEGVLPGDDKGSFIVNPYNCRRFVYFFHLKTMNLSIDWNTNCLLAGSDNSCDPALITIHNPNSDGGIFRGYGAYTILRSLN